MVFWISLVLFVASVIYCVYDYIKCRDGMFPVIAAVVTGFVAILMLCIIVCTHIGAKAEFESCKIRHDMLVYQYQNQFYDNDNDVGKYELIKDIREWNEELITCKNLQNDFWVGIFLADIYDELELIDIT